MDEAEREKLRLTLIGMVNSAMNKYPSASKGDLKDVWNAAVDERYALPQPGSGRRRSRIPEQPAVCLPLLARS